MALQPSSCVTLDKHDHEVERSSMWAVHESTQDYTSVQAIPCEPTKQAREAVFEPFPLLRGNGSSGKLSNLCKATQLESRAVSCWMAGSLTEDQRALASCLGLLHLGSPSPRAGGEGSLPPQGERSAEETHPPDKQSISFQSWSPGGGGATSAQVFIETDVWDGKRRQPPPSPWRRRKFAAQAAATGREKGEGKKGGDGG